VLSNRVVVIGTGPSALACCSELISHGIKPLVIDASGQHEIDENSDQIIHEKRLKTYGLDYTTYSQPKAAKLIYDTKLSVRQTFSFGGFSRVWGATLDMDLEAYEEDVIDKVKELLGWNDYLELKENSGDKVSKFIDEINQHKKHYTATRSRLAIKGVGDNSCKNSLSCFDKCPNSAIWFAGKLFEDLVTHKEVDYVGNLILTQLQINSGQLDLIFANGDSIRAQKVFLALGPIGSAAVLVKSGLYDSLRLRDTHTVHTALISMRRITQTVQQNALSKIWIKSSNKNGDFYIQMHQHSQIHLERLIDKLPPCMKFKRLAKILSRFVYPILIYSNEDVSGDILISSDGNSIRIDPIFPSEKKKKIKLNIREIRKFFFSLGMYLPISKTEIGQPGDGYHIGGSLRLGEHINSNGELISLSNVFVVDSSSLQQIPLGSVTPTIMANSIRITKSAIGQ